MLKMFFSIGAIALLLIAGILTVFLWMPRQTARESEIENTLNIAVERDVREIEEILFPDDSDSGSGRGNTAGNVVNGGNVVQSGEWVFYISREPFIWSVVRVNKNTMEKESLVSSRGSISCINIYDGWIYISKFTGIYRMRTNGMGMERLRRDEVQHGTLNISDGWIFYSNIGTANAQGRLENPSFYRMRADGTGRERISGRTGDISFTHVNVYDDMIFFMNMESNWNIYRMNFDGTEKARLNDSRSIWINVVDSWVYYVNRDHGNAIYKMRIDGTENQLLISVSTTSINVFDGWIYFNNLRNDGYLYKARIDGTDMQQVIEHPAFAIQVVEGWVYFQGEIGSENAFLARVRKDGSDFEYLYQIGEIIIPTN
jgi:hypothetical protein